MPAPASKRRLHYFCVAFMITILQYQLSLLRLESSQGARPGPRRASGGAPRKRSTLRWPRSHLTATRLDWLGTDRWPRLHRTTIRLGWLGIASVSLSGITLRYRPTAADHVHHPTHTVHLVHHVHPVHPVHTPFILDRLRRRARHRALPTAYPRSATPSSPTAPPTMATAPRPPPPRSPLGSRRNAPAARV